MTKANANYNAMTPEQIGVEIQAFSTNSGKRKEHAQFIALACMAQGANHRNLTPLTDFARVLTKAEHSCLRVWAQEFSPARKRKHKELEFTYKFQTLKAGETEQVFDFEGMKAQNFLDIDVEKEQIERLFGADTFLERVEKMVKEADKIVKGEKSNVTLVEEDRQRVLNLRNILAATLNADLDDEIEEVILNDNTEEQAAA